MTASDRIDPMRLTVEQAAKLLSRVAEESIGADEINADVEAGAPANSDGTINVVHYAAWLVKETSRRGD